MATSQVPDSVLRANDYVSKIGATVRPWITAVKGDEIQKEGMKELLNFYSDSIAQIAYDYRLTADALDETELFIGALVAPRKGRKRRVMLAAVNVELTRLLDNVRLEIGPIRPAQASAEEWSTALLSAHAAWLVSLDRLDRMGACSFNMIAFEAMFRCIDKLNNNLHV